MTDSLRQRICLVLVLLLCTGLSVTVLAQSTVDGGIVGTVVDPSKAVVTTATVTARNLETNVKSTGTTDSAGGFRLSHLRPGQYEVTVTASGFAAFKADKIVVEVGRLTAVEVNLSMESKAETIVVTGEAPVINTTQADFTNNVNMAVMNDMPINLRRWSAFAMLSPGATPDGPYGLVSFRGISGLMNNNTVDGGDNNSAYWGEERGRTRATSTIGQDSIREFQVNTSNFSAEYGKAAGAVVNAVTKSGTNHLHGTGHMFVTDSAMWAANPFSTQAVVSGSTITQVPLKPPDRRYQFGGNVGGPIIKDKMFFFVNWDQQRENAPGVANAGPQFWPTYSSTATAFTVSVPANCNTGTSGNNLTAGQKLYCRFNQVLINSATGVIAPPADGAGLVTVAQAQTIVNNAFNYLANLTGTVPRRKDQYILFPKLDWMITNKHTVTLGWNHMRWKSPGGVQTAPIVGRIDWGDDLVDVDTGNARLVSLVTNTMTNEFRVSIGRENQYQTMNAQHAGEPTTNASGWSPEINISGSGGTGLTFGQPYYIQRYAYPLENRWQFTDVFSMTRGNHFLKVGADSDYSKDTIDHLYRNGGVYSYSYTEDWIADWNNPKTCTVKPASTYLLGPCYSYFAQGFGPAGYHFATRDFSAFIQDDWHASRRLTVNLGLRWETERLPKTFWPNAALPVTASVPEDNRSLGPRLGFAADLTGDGKTVIRGGWGMYYGRVISAYLAGLLTNTGAASAQINTGSIYACDTTVPTPTCPLYPNVLSAGSLPKSSPTVWGSNTRLPLIHEADLVVEREIAHNTMVSVSYLMSLGRRLPFMYDANLPWPAGTKVWTISGGPLNGQTVTLPLYTGSRPNSAFNSIYTLDYSGKSRYDGIVLQVNRRMTDGLQFQVTYTHARATDTNPFGSTGTTTNQPLDPFNPALERGTSGFDIRHRFVAGAVYQPRLHGNPILSRVVNGFSISPLVSISSGAPQNWGISGNNPSSAGATSTGILGAGGSNRWPLIERNAFRGPTVGGANLRVSRRFNITEGKKLEVLGEVFNINNHMFPTSISSTLYQISSSTLKYCGVAGNCSAGLPGTVSGGNDSERVGNFPRQFQVGARFEF